MIEFTNPAALWLLTLIAPLVLLYLLKRRRQDVVVPSLMLWKQAMEDLRAHRPFQKLRSRLLLYLQILILVLITAILSGPRLVQSSQQSRRWVLVMDVSASMQATDENPDRFHVARDKLLRVLDQAAPADEVLLLSLGAEASVLQPFTTAHSSAREKLEALEAEDTPGNWQQLARVLEPLMKEAPLPRVVIASDFSGFPAEMQNRIPFDPERVGRQGDNVAITRAVTEPLPGSAEEQQLFYQIQNDSTSSRIVEVDIQADHNVIDAFSMPVAPSGIIDRTTNLTITAPAEIRLRISPADALALDNEFVLHVEPGRRAQVDARYENVFLLKALGALPLVERAHPGEIRIEKTLLQNQTSPGIYFVHAAPASPSGRVLQWNSAHPVLRFVDAGMWSFTRYAVLTPPADATVLIETALGPVGYASERNGERRIVLGFTLEDSNLYRLAGFPVFLQNAIQWIDEDLHSPLPSVTGPEIRKEGAFEMGKSKGYANFADAGESKILPGNPRGLAKSGTQNVPRRRDVSRWFLILALGIVIVEWWAFHRRMEL